MRCEQVETPMRARPSKGKLVCKGCGCTEEAACPGGCYWVSFDPPVCSVCHAAAEDMAGAVSLYGDELCPASKTPAAHVPLFTSETEWHCVHCQIGFFA